MTIRVKRIYTDPSGDDGHRVLVDRLWPRGFSKERAALRAWLPDLAPTAGLRNWYKHDPDKWTGFQKRYFRDLDNGQGSESLRTLRELIATGTVKLLFASKEEELNNAVALKNYLSRARRA